MNHDADMKRLQKVMLKRGEEITTQKIAKWIGCSRRHLQKWAKENNIETRLSDGRKYYVWNDESLQKVQIYLSGKKERTGREKPKKYRNYYKRRTTDTFTFTTVQKLAEEIQIPLYWQHISETKKEMLGDHSYESKIRYIRQWCSENEVSFQWVSGSKYYAITDEIKSQIIEYFNE